MSLGVFLRENWPFLLVGVLLTFLSSFGQTFFISVFAGEIQSTFNLTSGEWGALYATGTLVSGLLMIWAGMLSDKLRVRVLGPAVLVGLAAATLTMAVVPEAAYLPFVIFLLRFFGQGMASHVAIVAMSRWFVATRGRAVSIAGVGFAMGEAFLPMIFVSLLVVADWRVLWIVAAAIPLLLSPVIYRLLKLERSPAALAEESLALGLDGRHWTRGEVLKSPLFWMILPFLIGPPAFSTSFFFLQVHLAEVKGWSHTSLVALFPVFTIFGIIGGLSSGWVVDRIGSARLIPFIQLPMAAGFLVISMTGSIGATAVAMGLMGLSQGMVSTVPNVFWAEFFGTRHIGSVKAMATAVMVMGSAFGPWITGVFIDRGMQFPEQMPFIATYFTIAAILVLIAVTRAAPRLTPAP
ncbi:MAG: MFS transporter [Pseudomonadota bacterium]